VAGHRVTVARHCRVRHSSPISPKTPTGKLLRRELRERAIDG